MNCVDCEYAVHLIDKRINHLKGFGAEAFKKAEFEVKFLRKLQSYLKSEELIEILNKRGF